MIYTIVLHRLFLTAILSIPSLANPLGISQDLAERDNKWNLKCSNAPTVVAGSLLNPSQETNPLPPILPDSGSDQPWFKYLWCVPGTPTYLFLNTGRLEPPSLTYRDVRGALYRAIAQTQTDLTQLGDGPIASPYNGYMTPQYEWYVTPPGTNMQVYASSYRGVLTRGVLVAALTGLGQFVDGGYDFGDVPIVFQINSGPLGEVGIGYVGFVDPADRDDKCIYWDVQGETKYCEDVAAGKVIS